MTQCCVYLIIFPDTLKITSRILNFVTETCSNFFELKIRFLYYNLYIVELLYVSSTNA